jgi:N-acetylglucosamine kinase
MRTDIHWEAPGAPHSADKRARQAFPWAARDSCFAGPAPAAALLPEEGAADVRGQPILPLVRLDSVAVDHPLRANDATSKDARSTWSRTRHRSTKRTELFYGIEIGNASMRLAACDADGAIQYSSSLDTPGLGFDGIADAICDLVGAADRELGSQYPLGLAAPGIVDSSTGAHQAANLPSLRGRALQPLLQARLGRPILLGNEGHCFALSEAHGGAGAGYPSLFGVILGIGAGAGYVVEGRLVRGRNGAAGEWGHWPLAPALLARYGLRTLPCPCGASACLERYLAAPGLRQLHAYQSGEANVPADVLARRSDAGDHMARASLALHAELLGAAIAHIVLAYDPHVIVLGGELSRLSHLYKELPDAIQAHLLPGLQAPPVLPAHFGDAGSARGAALLARQSLPASLALS